MPKIAKPGYVYVLDPNVEVNGRRVLKIGYTTGSVRKRVQQLSTGSVGGFRVVHQQHVADAPVVERRVHSALQHARVNREFFAVTLDEARREIARAGPTARMSDADLRWSAAMREFRNRIGATAAEGRVQAARLKATWLTLGAWVVGCIYAIYSGVIQGLLALPFGLLVAGAAAYFVDKLLRPRWVDRPFREQIVIERERLDRLFPDSFHATWRQDRRIA